MSAECGLNILEMSKAEYDLTKFSEHAFSFSQF